jgi:3',5'-cyclic AMP phosphodiesterase CpdA
MFFTIDRFGVIFLLCASVAAASTALAEVRQKTTRRSSHPELRIALVSDPHVSTKPRCAPYIEHFKQVIAEVNKAKIDLVLIPGDLTDDAQPASFAEFREMAKGFESPVLFVPGNHDVGNRPLPPKPATVTEAKIARYEKQIGSPFYVKEPLPALRVIGITSSIFASGLASEDKQWSFLGRELASPHDGFTLLLSHYPPFFAHPDEVDDYFNISTASRTRLLALLKQGQVAAILSGHLHRPIALNWDGIPIIGAPAVSFGLPPKKQPEGWTLVTLHGDGRVTSAIHYLPSPSTAPAVKTATTRPTD